MTVISDYQAVPALRDATYPDDLGAILADPDNHTLDVVIGLSDWSDVVAFEHPRDGLKVAQAAIKVAGLLPKHTHDWFLGHSRSFSIAASRLRGIGELGEADALFSASYDFLRSIAGEHFEERGDFYRRLAFLRIDQRALGLGLDIANHSLLHFARANNNHGKGCGLISRGGVYLKLKKYPQAAGDYRSALDLLDPALGFNHVWAAALNLAHALIDGAAEDRDMSEAIDQLKAVNDLRRYDEGTVPYIFVCWAEGRLLMKLGEFFSAQAKLVGVCRALEQLDQPFELTQAFLDLARTYYAQRQLEEVVRLAGEMFPLFSRYRHDQRAYRALTRFHHAALEGGLEDQMIVEARSAVEVATMG